MSAWLDQIFDAKQVSEGGVVRRSIDDVDKLGGGLSGLLVAVKARGFHLIEIADQYVILCNDGEMKVHTKNVTIVT